jgi:exopolysaccharide biosynthesis polyprenyl glycosylphosphotransferase
MFSSENRLLRALFVALDALIALVSFWIAQEIRARMARIWGLNPAYNYVGIVPIILLIWITVGWAHGLYDRPLHERPLRLVPRLIRITIFSTLVLFAVTFAIHYLRLSRFLLLIFALIDLLGMLALRLITAKWNEPLHRALGGHRHFLLVGNTPDAIAIATFIEANEPRGLKLTGFAVFGNPGPAQPAIDQSKLVRNYPVWTIDKIPDLLHGHVIDEVIFAVSKDDVDKLSDTFLMCEEEGVRTRILLSFFPHLISKVYLEHLSDMALLTFSTIPENRYLMLAKRVADFLMAAIMLLILSPVFLVLSILIKLTDGGPVFFRQTRCGLGGRKFTLYKFRSMIVGAEKLRAELEKLNEKDGPIFKIKNDPRCTRIGRLMRRLSLDELPQLFNVIKGDMSFVGPRPPIPEEVEKYERWQRRRLRMQPGLTCLWALEGRSHLNFQRWMELDLEYIDHWSPALDWKIILKTIPVVLLGRGAS